MWDFILSSAAFSILLEPILPTLLTLLQGNWPLLFILYVYFGGVGKCVCVCVCVCSDALLKTWRWSCERPWYLDITGASAHSVNALMALLQQHPQCAARKPVREWRLFCFIWLHSHSLLRQCGNISETPVASQHECTLITQLPIVSPSWTVIAFISLCMDI